MKKEILISWLILLFFILIFSRNNRADPNINQKNDNQQETVRLGVEMVSFTVTVTDDYQRLVSGLSKENFQIFEDNVKQEIEFFSDEDSPASIGIILDVSGSMSEKIKKAKLALKKFIEYSNSKDEFFIVSFSESAHLVYDFNDFTGDLGRFDFIKAKGQTAVFDAVFLGLEKINEAKHKEKKALIVISDGQDNTSRYSFGEVQQKLKESGVIVYCIGITLSSDDPGLRMQGLDVLNGLADVSGGRSFENTELEDTVSRISLELRHQYSLGYYPTNSASNGKWRKVKVKVKALLKGKRLYVRARGGYYAPK